MELKVGDRVHGTYGGNGIVNEVAKKGYYDGTVFFVGEDNRFAVKGIHATIQRDDFVNGSGRLIPGYGEGWNVSLRSDGTWGGSGNEGKLEIISKSITTNKTTKMGLLNKLAELVAKEPWKTFKKLGITNGDDLLTNEGRELYIQWKFKQDADKFAEEVATPMLEAQEKENNKK